MSLDLKGSRVFVSGSSKGIGQGIVNAFIDCGCKVVSNSRGTVSASQSNFDKKNFLHIQGDVSDPLQAEKIMDQAKEFLGGLDILVCNVGNGSSVEPGNENHQEWVKMFDINFFSATNLVEAANSELFKSKGSVVCISSICGLETIPGAPVTYSAAKAALNSYIKGISIPMANHGVRINGIAPGNILFPGSIWEKKLQENPKSVNKMLDQNVPLNRLGTIEDVANLVLWLSSPASSFVTGTIFTVDGGQTRS